MGYSFRLIARVLLYAPSYRHDCTYHDLCYTSRGALAGTRKVPNSVYFAHLWYKNRSNFTSTMNEKEGNVLFNNVLNTFYLRLYGIGQTVKDQSDSERRNQLSPIHELPFLLAARYLLCAPSHRQNSTHHGICYTSCVALAGTRNT